MGIIFTFLDFSQKISFFLDVINLPISLNTNFDTCPNDSESVFWDMDFVIPEKRSWVMSQVKCMDTRPEKIVRLLLHGMGLPKKDLPGKPDIVLPRYKTVIFVHGCFWHRHSCPDGSRLPKTRVDYWRRKLEGNHIASSIVLKPSVFNGEVETIGQLTL